MTFKAIVAVATNGVIGYNGEMPWYLPKELAYFKQCTLQKPVIMGRKTFDGIINRLGKPLPNRYSIVLSRTESLRHYPSTKFVTSVANAVADAQSYCSEKAQTEAMVIGGATIYKAFENIIDGYYITKIKLTPNGDSYFQLPNFAKWQLLSSKNACEHNISYQKQYYIKN